MQYVYFALIRAKTLFANAARRATDFEYTHCAVALDSSLSEFYTFARRRHYAPMDCGFVREYREYYDFRRDGFVTLKVFRIPTCPSRIAVIKKFIEQCEKGGISFDFASMLTMPVLHGIDSGRRLNCMSFTTIVAGLTGRVRLERSARHYDIRELDELLAPYFYVEGDFPTRPTERLKEYMRLI